MDNATDHRNSTNSHTEPSFAQKLSSLFSALSHWAAAGFPVVDHHVYISRREACAACEHWDESGYASLGKCRLCGCTAAKLALATSECPIGKWHAVQRFVSQDKE